MAKLSGRRILVVDDEPMAALMLERMLRELGCGVPGRTGTAGDAIAIIQTNRADLDAATVKLTDKGRADVAKALEVRGIPFLIITRPGAPALPGSLTERPILQAPFLIEELREALAALPMKQRYSSKDI